MLRGSLAAAAAVSGAAAYARFVERLDVEAVAVAADIGLGRPLRVAVLGDVHFDPFFELAYLERIVATVSGLTPDVLLHTGDFVSHTADRIDECAAALGRLSPRLAHLAVLGNHDHWIDADRIADALERRGVEVLRNRSVALAGVPGWFVTGLESFWSGRPDPSTVRTTSADARHIVLAHEPDAFDLLTDPRYVLQLSGHTHGGQVRVPGYGAISLPSWGKRYQMGAYAVDGRQLYVHRGLGTVDDHVRLNCRPEITLLTLT
jgi:predicted MPP superfamily phosphohydrolase